jgi:hypothetical protein
MVQILVTGRCHATAEIAKSHLFTVTRAMGCAAVGIFCFLSAWQLLQSDLKPQDLPSSARFAPPYASHIAPASSAKVTVASWVQAGDWDGQRMLQTPNPNWPNLTILIHGNCSVCGVVMGKVESFI